MTVDPNAPKDVDGLVCPHKTYFPSKVPCHHNQLRHLISSPKSGCVYLCNDKDIYRIDVATRRRTHVQELPFQPRCTATGHGYFCAGEENGYFASIRIPDGPPGTSSAAVDSPLPDFLVNGERLDRSNSLLEQTTLSGRPVPPRIRIEKLGSDILNSITIHKLPATDQNHPDDVVAVLTNNDKTVRLYSLTRDVEIKVDDFPFAMNHASISPDGRLLVVVGDWEFIFFYIRKDPPSKPASSYLHSDNQYKWQQLKVLRLHKPSRAPHSSYFTTAWSPSGRLCATASEDGYITVYDVDRIAEAETDSDPIVMIAPSSRPNTIAGAVRAMSFAPDPWDLLIWAENNGRICVGDLRTGLNSRQVVNLTHEDGNVTKIQLADSTSAYDDLLSRDGDLDMLDLVRRNPHLFSRAAAADGSATGLLTTLQERRRLDRQGTAADIVDEPPGLSEDERAILDGLRTTREREEQMPQDSLTALQQIASQGERPTPRSINYTSRQRNRGSPFSASGRQTPIPSSSGGELERLRQDAAMLGRLREYMRDDDSNRQDGSSSSPQGTPQPRHWGAYILHGNAGVDNENSTSPERSSSDPWRTIEAALARASTPSATNPSSNSTYASVIANRTSSGLHDALNRSGRVAPFAPISRPSEVSAGPSTTTSVTLRDPVLDSSPAAGLHARHREQIDLLRERREALREREREHQRELREIERSYRRDAATLDRYTQAHGLLRRSIRNSAALTASEEGRIGGIAVGLRRYGGGHAHILTEDEAREWGVGTTGLAVAEGGRVVYVGTEEGVWEVRLDFAGRKGWGRTEMS